MPPSSRPGKPPPRHFARGLLAIAVTAALVVGLPALLWAAVGWPLPHAVPSVAELREAFLHQSISDQVILNGLAVLTWLAWAQFLACLIIEAKAGLRGHLPRRVPLATWGTQALAARLVAAVLVLAPLSTPARPAIAASPVVAHPVITRIFESNTAARSDTPTERAPTTSHVVQPKETLWDVAERHYGDGRLYRKIFESNEGRLQPDGRRVTNPNRIYPGWVLDVPPLSDEPTPGLEEPDPGSAGQRPPATTAPVEPPAAVPTPSPVTSDTGDPAEPSAEHSPGAQIRLPAGGVVGISLATALSAALGLAWLHRRRAYRPSPPAPGMWETDPLLTPTVRLLCQIARQRERATEDDDHDTVRAPISITRARKATHDQRPPAPSYLRTVGVGTREGAEIPLDLAATSGLGVRGPGAQPAVRALIAGAIAEGHGEAAQVLLAGDKLAAELLPGVSSFPGLTLLPDLNAALARLEVELVHRTRLLDGDEATDIATFAAANPGEPLPLLLLVAQATPPALQQRLATVIALGRRLGIAAVVLGPSPAGPTIDVAADGHVDAIDPASAVPELSDAWLFTLPTDQVQQVLAVIGTGAGAAPSTELTEEPSSQVASMVELEASTEPRPVSVRLLGPLRIDALGVEIRSGLRGKARELLAFLVLHPAGMTTDQIVDALWPEVDLQRGTQRFRTALGNLRSTLRLVTSQPNADVIEWTGSHYRIQDDLFECDAWRFQAALDQAADHAESGDRILILERAVAAYGGDLLEGEGSLWSEPSREDLRRRAIDALVRLAELHRGADNPEAALHAIERAISLDPYAETLYRQAMRLHDRLGRADGVRRTLRHLENRLEELDLDPDETTHQLAQELLAKRATT